MYLLKARNNTLIEGNHRNDLKVINHASASATAIQQRLDWESVGRDRVSSNIGMSAKGR